MKITGLLMLLVAVSAFAPVHQACAVYDAGTGRWLTRDPAQYVDGSNLYEYGRSGPVALRDAYGLSCSTCQADPIGPGVVPSYVLCKDNPFVERALQLLRQRGCSVPEIRQMPQSQCDTLLPDEFAPSGLYCCATNVIYLCPDTTCETVAHELIHRLDYCTGMSQCLPVSTPWQSTTPCGGFDGCASLGCSAVRANALSGQCCRSPGLDMLCLRRKVESELISVGCGADDATIDSYIAQCLPANACTSIDPPQMPFTTLTSARLTIPLLDPISQ